MPARVTPRPARLASGLLCVGLFFGVAGCGGESRPRCEAAACQAGCAETGGASGVCRDAMCVCQPGLPAGASGGLSSGGAVHREGRRFRLDLSVAPVPPAAERTGSERALELGVLPPSDPDRAAPAP